MRQSFAVHPGGIAGGGLLLLRCALALYVVKWVLATTIPHWALFLLSLSVLGLFFGLWTRSIALICAALGLLLLVGHGDAPLLCLGAEILQALGLAALGPGAFSIDAMRFGRAKTFLSRKG